MVHEAILQPFVFEQSYVSTKDVGVDEADSRKNIYKDAVKEYEEKNDKKVLKLAEFDYVQGMVRQVHSHVQASNLLSGGQAEQALYWTDSVTGVLCKCKPDYLREDGIIVDLKTTKDGSPGQFAKDIANYGYHVSAAFQLSGLSRVVGRTLDNFVMVVVEKSEPYVVGCYNLDFGSMEKGESLAREALNIYAECVKKDNWPGYSEEVRSIAIPGWAF